MLCSSSPATVLLPSAPSPLSPTKQPPATSFHDLQPPRPTRGDNSLRTNDIEGASPRGAGRARAYAAKIVRKHLEHLRAEARGVSSPANAGPTKTAKPDDPWRHENLDVSDISPRKAAGSTKFGANSKPRRMETNPLTPRYEYPGWTEPGKVTISPKPGDKEVNAFMKCNFEEHGRDELFRRVVRHEKLRTRPPASLHAVDATRAAIPVPGMSHETYALYQNAVKSPREKSDGKEFRRPQSAAGGLGGKRREEVDADYPLGFVSALADNVISPIVSPRREPANQPPSYFDRFRGIGQAALVCSSEKIKRAEFRDLNLRTSDIASRSSRSPAKMRVLAEGDNRDRIQNPANKAGNLQIDGARPRPWSSDVLRNRSRRAEWLEAQQAERPATAGCSGVRTKATYLAALADVASSERVGEPETSKVCSAAENESSGCDKTSQQDAKPLPCSGIKASEVVLGPTPSPAPANVVEDSKRATASPAIASTAQCGGKQNYAEGLRFPAPTAKTEKGKPSTDETLLLQEPSERLFPARPSSRGGAECAVTNSKNSSEDLHTKIEPQRPATAGPTSRRLIASRTVVASRPATADARGRAVPLSAAASPTAGKEVPRDLAEVTFFAKQASASTAPEPVVHSEHQTQEGFPRHHQKATTTGAARTPRSGILGEKVELRGPARPFEDVAPVVPGAPGVPALMIPQPKGDLPATAAATRIAFPDKVRPQSARPVVSHEPVANATAEAPASGGGLLPAYTEPRGERKIEAAAAEHATTTARQERAAAFFTEKRTRDISPKPRAQWGDLKPTVHEQFREFAQFPYIPGRRPVVGVSPRFYHQQPSDNWCSIQAPSKPGMRVASGKSACSSRNQVKNRGRVIAGAGATPRGGGGGRNGGPGGSAPSSRHVSPRGYHAVGTMGEQDHGLRASSRTPPRTGRVHVHDQRIAKELVSARSSRPQPREEPVFVQYPHSPQFGG